MKHQNHHAHMAADFQKRFWISLVLTVPILVWTGGLVLVVTLLLGIAPMRRIARVSLPETLR